MQFISQVEFIDESDHSIILDSSNFVHSTPDSITLQIPNDGLMNSFFIKLYVNEKQFFETPFFKFKSATSGGHLENKKHYIWESDGTEDAVNWNNVYRFSNVETSTGEEIYAIPMDEWAIIKEGTFYFLFDGANNSNVRITTGWWTVNYRGMDNCCELAEDDDETGKKVIKINIKEDGTLYDLIDEQHLLFTGVDYTALGIYIIDKVWVEE